MEREIGDTRGGEQGRNGIGRSQREPEAGREPTWDQAGGARGVQARVISFSGWEEKGARDSGQVGHGEMFDGKFVNYPRFKKEWQAYRQAYNTLESNNLGCKVIEGKVW
jgi:hypothetical protein